MIALEEDMPKWRKSPAELIELFGKALDKIPEADRRQMFGYPVAFANDNLFTGLHQENMFVRLAESDRKLILEAGGAAFEPIAGRAMKEYVVLPQALLGKPDTLDRWLRKSMNYAGALPPKKKKKPRRQTRR